MPASRSEQTPSAGLAVMPEKESDPPQFSPSTIFEAGSSTRCSAAARSMKRGDLAARGFDGGAGAAALLQGQAGQAAARGPSAPR